MCKTLVQTEIFPNRNLQRTMSRKWNADFKYSSEK